MRDNAPDAVRSEQELWAGVQRFQEAQTVEEAAQAQEAAIVAVLKDAEAERLAGIRERVKNGVAGMVADLSQKGVNPIVGGTLGMLTGVLNTWLDHASDQDVDTMLTKITDIVGSWRQGEVAA